MLTPDDECGPNVVAAKAIQRERKILEDKIKQVIELKDAISDMANSLGYYSAGREDAVSFILAARRDMISVQSSLEQALSYIN